MKVLILPAFEVEKMTGDFPGEAQFYYESYLMDSEEYTVEGTEGKETLYYKDGIALCLLDEGKVSAALNTKAVLSDDSKESFDIFETAMKNNFKAGKIVIEAILNGEL